MTSLPTLNSASPDRYSASEVALYGIPAVTSAVEPGSVFQAFTAAAAFDAGAATPESSFVNAGSLSYDGSRVSDTSAHAPGPMTVLQSLALSSNVGAAWMGTKAGPYRYYQSIHLLELGTRTGVDLPGEVDGLLRLPTDLDWTGADLAANSYGHGLAVTPLQLASATAAIANAGVPATPYIVRQIGQSVDAKPISPEPRPGAVRPESARALTGMLQAIVDDRSTTEGRLARVSGYALAGTAGSAVVPDALTSSHSSTISTFIGFGPVERPSFALAIRIDAASDGVAPDEVTSPVFSAIASQLLNYYQIPPSRPIVTNGR